MFPEMELLDPGSKNKKNPPRKIFLITVILKNFLHFLKRKLFLYFRKWKPRKNFFYFLKRKLFFVFWEMELFHILGNGNPE